MLERFFANSVGGFGKIGGLFELARPWNGLIIGLVAVLGYALLSPAPSIFYSAIMFLSFIFVYAAGTTLNDIFDLEHDRINMPYRPLQTGRVTVNEAYLFALFFYIASVLTGLYLGIEFTVFVILFIVFSLTYSVPPVRLVDRAFAGNINLALVTILFPACAGAAYELHSLNIPSAFLIPFLSFTALFTFASMIKDLKDIKGDKEKGKKTFAVIFGKRNTIIASILGAVIFFPLTTYLFSSYFEEKDLLYGLSALIFIMLILTKLYKHEGYVQRIEDERFGKVRLTMLPYVLLLLLLAFMG